MLPATPERPDDLRSGARATGVIVWSAFLAAALGTMICFAVIDPEALGRGDAPEWWTSRPRVYAIGFFLLWFTGLLAASLSWYLCRPGAARVG